MHSLSWKKKLLFWVIVAAIPLLTVELGCRVYFAHQLGSSLLFYGTRLNRERSGDAHTGDMNLKGEYFKYHPHQERYTRDENGRLVPCTINAHGFRGPEFDVAKAPGVTRIVTLGASSTFGFHNRDETTYPCLLEQDLNDHSHGGESFQVINLGVPHLDSNQIRALFEAEALPLHPDIVTFYEGVNDSWRSPVLYEREQETMAGHREVRRKLRRISPLHRAFRWGRDHLITIKLANAFVKRAPAVTFDAQDVEEHMRGKSDTFLGNLDAINNECRRRGILFIVVSQQAKSRLVDRDHIRGVSYDEEREMVLGKLMGEGHVTRHELYFLTHAGLMRDLEEWCETNAVPYVDAIAALDERRDCLVSWVHLNPEGNGIVAEALSQEILARVASVSRTQ